MDAATLRAAMVGHLSAAEQRQAALTDARYAELAPAVDAALTAAGCTTQRRAAAWLSQVGHESVGLRYQQEIWGPSAVQRRYEGRADLGNTQPGDGYRYRGHGWLQITGRAHHAEVSRWAHSRGLVPTPTYFVDRPDDLGLDRYAGLAVAWYWTVARPKLNALCDAGDIVAVTKAINGGTTGLPDRQRRYANCVALGDRILPSAPATVGLDQGLARRRTLLLAD